MKLFGSKNFKEDGPDMTGRVIARIIIDRIDIKTTKVKAYAVSRDTGKTVFKLRYETSEKSDTACFYAAENIVRQFVREQKLVIDGNIGTNIELPFVRTLEGKTSYLRR